MAQKVWTPPSWVEELPFDPPDSISVCDFITSEKHGRRAHSESKAPYTCGLTGKEYSSAQVKERVENLANGLAKELGWEPNKGSEWDKVIGIFAVNTIDTLPVAWATHRLSGICSPANAAYSVEELVYQLKTSKPKAMFTCVPLLPIALEAAAQTGIPKNRIYMLELPKQATGGEETPKEYMTVDQLIELGKEQPKLEELKWEKGQGARQTAFLCYSSGTSGLPKGVMISHRNIISNIMQISTFERPWRRHNTKKGEKEWMEIVLGLLPQSHIYGLVFVCHVSTYRGDQVIVLPKFELDTFLSSIQRFKIDLLFLVPPIVIVMTKNKKKCDQFDLTSVKSICSGAAPLGPETQHDMQTQYPKWYIKQAYGMTESSPVSTMTIWHDIYNGSAGSLVPGQRARLVDADGKDVHDYDTPGELWLQGPNIVLGYLNNVEATEETFGGGWMKTGDEAVIRKSKNGHEHVFITDRIKELIKVKGHQVAPAELEAHILTHHSVADCAVISIPGEDGEEKPKAFVVKSDSVGIEDNDRMLMRDITRHVEKSKAKYKWLTGGVEFIDVVPKSASGKILRRMLRDKEKEERRKKGSKL